MEPLKNYKVEKMTEKQEAEYFEQQRRERAFQKDLKEKLAKMGDEKAPVLAEEDMSEAKCSICMNIMIEPLKLSQCGHRFCIQCINQAFSRDQEDKCPMCRKSYSKQMLKNKFFQASDVDVTFKKQIQAKYPDAFAEREVELKQAGMLIRDSVKITLEVGNRYEAIKKPRKNNEGYSISNKWTAFVRIKNPEYKKLLGQLVEYCTFELHETYKCKDKVKKVELQRNCTECYY